MSSVVGWPDIILCCFSHVKGVVQRLMMCDYMVDHGSVFLHCCVCTMYKIAVFVESALQIRMTEKQTQLHDLLFNLFGFHFTMQRVLFFLVSFSLIICISIVDSNAHDILYR